MEIRPYNSSDADTILSWCGDEKAFYRWTAGVMGEYPITSKEFSFVEAMDAFTAVEDDKPIGFFTLRRPDESVNVLRIGFVIVDPALRGKGLGKQMMKLGLDHAVNDMKADAVTLGVFENNLPAYYCYKAAGFHDVKLEQAETYKVLGEEWACKEMRYDKG